MDVSTFTTTYPEFGNATKYPDAVIARWLDLASIMLNAERWGAALDFGTGLFVAHNLALGAVSTAAAKKGGAPGQQIGPLSSKSVGHVSASYDTGAGIEPGAGHWNLTTYGTRFIQQARYMGAGPGVY